MALVVGKDNQICQRHSGCTNTQDRYPRTYCTGTFASSMQTRQSPHSKQKVNDSLLKGSKSWRMQRKKKQSISRGASMKTKIKSYVLVTEYLNQTHHSLTQTLLNDATAIRTGAIFQQRPFSCCTQHNRPQSINIILSYYSNMKIAHSISKK